MGLYKFLSDKRYDVISTQLFRFTQPLQWNDPFEMRPFYYDDKKPEFIGEIFSPDYIDVNDINSLINSNFVSLSLTENPYNLLMWAHYTNDHKGFVIEFDENHDFFKEKRKYLFRVPYSNTRPILEKKQVLDLCKDLIAKFKNGDKISLIDFQKFSLIFHKSLEWSEEKEWRLVTLQSLSEYVENTDKKLVFYTQNYNTPARNRQISNYKCFFKIPLESIKSIIFGYNAIINEKKKIIALCNSDKSFSHIKLLETITDRKEYKLIFKELIK